MLNNVIDEGLIYQQLIVLAEVGKIFTKEAINYPHILKIFSLLAVGRKYFKHGKIGLICPLQI